MFFREYPLDWARSWGVLAYRFGWTQKDLEELTASDLSFWIERLEEVGQMIRDNTRRR